MSVTASTSMAISEQIRAEFHSAYVYLDMSSWFTNNNLPGFAHWMRMQWQEETLHAMKLYDFLHNRGGTVQLLEISAPTAKYATAIEVFEAVQHHEQMITQKINDLYEVAQKEKDLPLQIVLQWFINEQVEEEAQVSEILVHLKMIGADGPALYLLDRQLASRAKPSTTQAE